MFPYIKEGNKDMSWYLQEESTMRNNSLNDNKNNIREFKVNEIEMKQNKNIFYVESETQSAAIQKYHIQSLNLAALKILTTHINEKDFQSLSLVLSLEQVFKIKKMIQDFYEEVLNETETETKSKPKLNHKTDIEPKVYHLNVQLFPISK